jgi:hypothetical protein
MKYEEPSARCRRWGFEDRDADRQLKSFGGLSLGGRRRGWSGRPGRHRQRLACPGLGQPSPSRPTRWLRPCGQRCLGSCRSGR